MVLKLYYSRLPANYQLTLGLFSIFAYFPPTHAHWTFSKFGAILIPMKHLLKPLSFLPALLMMYAIYSFSGQTGDVSSQLSYKISYKVVQIGNEVLDKDFDEYQIEEHAHAIEYYVRKAAHMTEYFLLAVAISFPLYVYGLRGLPLLIIAGGLCVGYACLDEFHQSFVAGRGPSKKDVAIDSIGVFIGIMAVRIVCWTSIQMMPKKKKR